MSDLRQLPGNGARALELAISTAARSREVRAVSWSEFDLANAVWDIPESRMKAKRPHRVPLFKVAVNLLEVLPRNYRQELVFPGERNSRSPKGIATPIRDMTLSAVIQRMNAPVDSAKWIDPKSGDEVVPHGF
jgi:integrase